ncbi:MAG: UbiA prenyltransferase family protein [Cyclobacteriaceae bacterium]|nr:UbiA prenyltransferase family protein [Cyclobacteriaceae bacterium]
MRSTILHLRFLFSWFLMPVYFFALAISPNLNGDRLLWSFVIIHLLVYPASNGYNSYFDKDEGSIGGLKNPPPVNRSLFVAAWLLDLVAVGLAWWKVNSIFAAMILLYGLASKAYSHPAVRLKKYPIAGWLWVAFFQGVFTFVMCYAGINALPLENLVQTKVLIPGALASLMLLGTYPMTQVYQHAEDAKRGDTTISLKLGVRGTFGLVMGIFSLASVLYAAYFYTFFEWRFALSFLVALFPVVVFFLIWFYRVWRNEEVANYRNTMWLNFLSATCLNGFFFWLFWETSHINQL